MSNKTQKPSLKLRRRRSDSAIIFSNPSFAISYNGYAFAVKIKGIQKEWAVRPREIDMLPSTIQEFILGKRYQRALKRACAARGWEFPKVEIPAAISASAEVLHIRAVNKAIKNCDIADAIRIAAEMTAAEGVPCERYEFTTIHLRMTVYREKTYMQISFNIEYDMHPLVKRAIDSGKYKELAIFYNLPTNEIVTYNSYEEAPYVAKKRHLRASLLSYQMQLAQAHPQKIVSKQELLSYTRAVQILDKSIKSYYQEVYDAVVVGQALIP